MFHGRLQGRNIWRRSAEEQAWLDVAPVGREFGSSDYERLETLGRYAAGKMDAKAVMLKLGIDNLEDLHQIRVALKP